MPDTDDGDEQLSPPESRRVEGGGWGERRREEGTRLHSGTGSFGPLADPVRERGPSVVHVSPIFYSTGLGTRGGRKERSEKERERERDWPIRRLGFPVNQRYERRPIGHATKTSRAISFSLFTYAVSCRGRRPRKKLPDLLRSQFLNGRWIADGRTRVNDLTAASMHSLPASPAVSFFLFYPHGGAITSRGKAPPNQKAVIEWTLSLYW